MTTRNFIRTITDVRPEWLLEFAANYFDLREFPDGEAKRALERVIRKMEGKRADGGDERRDKKKRKKDRNAA